ncbi:MAG TPA: TIR domain-containing protein [Lacunisphaera sp.]|nr:TIR domain-containing protein [Lacunisphaera sp.]
MSDPGKAVFLSYASQDMEAAKRIAEALRSAGVEVWFDAEGGLEHGDEWDAKIRRQIKECVLFIPVISANTEAREEGYFRIEWDLAAERARGIATGVAFILPVVVDETKEQEALVPDRFRAVQWTKLPGGRMPAEVAARFVKLWSHRAGVLKQRSAEMARDGAGGAGPGRPASARPATTDLKQPGWKAYAGLAVAIFGVAGAATWWLARGARENAPPPPAPPATATTPDPQSQTPDPKPLSEARQLAAKARAMSVDKYDSSIDDYTAAEGWIKRALQLDETDGEIWAVSSLLNFSFASRGFERTPAREAAARAHAERALKLAPDSIEALFALARWQRDFEEPAIAEASLLKVLARNPNHPGALHSLGYLYDRLDRIDEAAALYAREAQIPGQAPLAGFTEYLMYFRRARFAEAERAVRKSIAAEPSSNSQCGLAMLLLTAKGDAEAAAAAVATGPATLRREHRAIWLTAYIHLCRRQPDEALRALNRLADEFILDNMYTGPKNYWVGLAHAQAGREAAARVAWEAGLTLTDQRLRTTPADVLLRLARGELLALLGREQDALAEVHTLEQLTIHERAWPYTPLLVHAALGHADDALPLIEQQLRWTREHHTVGWPLTPALLRIDPRWDKLRNDPRFRKLCEEPPPPARDWPKDPELKRAIDLIEGLDSNADDFGLAEEIAKRAVERSPADADAAAVMARVQSQYLRRGFDLSDERSALARRHAENALRLSPDEPEAMHALAAYLISRRSDAARAERLLRRAMELDPTNPRLGRQLAELLFVTNRREEAIATAQANCERFPNDVLSRYDLARLYKDSGRYEEFERELDATLKIGPLANAAVWKARLQFDLRNDFAGMKSWLDRVPERARSTERAVFGYFLYAVYGGNPEVGLEALRAFPQKWWADFQYTGPTALLKGNLLELQGKTELARQQYEVALAEIQKMRTAEPERAFLGTWEFWTLLGLGRHEEARAVNRRLQESASRPYSLQLVNGWWFTPIPASLMLGDRATAVQLIREAAASAEGRKTIQLRLQLDPRLAAFRDDAEIKTLLAEPANP